MSPAHNPSSERRAVERVIARIRPLADHFSPSSQAPKIITIARADYQLLERATKTRGAFNIFKANDGSLHWGAFTLRTADAGAFDK